MKIRVDQLKCDTSGICVMECPELFRFQEGSKKAKALVEEVPPSMKDICIRIADRCPSKAIILEE
jgi:ferredoxin